MVNAASPEVYQTSNSTKLKCPGCDKNLKLQNLKIYYTDLQIGSILNELNNLIYLDQNNINMEKIDEENRSKFLIEIDDIMIPESLGPIVERPYYFHCRELNIKKEELKDIIIQYNKDITHLCNLKNFEKIACPYCNSEFDKYILREQFTNDNALEIENKILFFRNNANSKGLIAKESLKFEKSLIIKSEKNITCSQINNSSKVVLHCESEIRNFDEVLKEIFNSNQKNKINWKNQKVIKCPSCLTEVKFSNIFFNADEAQLKILCNELDKLPNEL